MGEARKLSRYVAIWVFPPFLGIHLVLPFLYSIKADEFDNRLYILSSVNLFAFDE